MGKSREDFIAFLLRQKIISNEQLNEARNFQQKAGCKLEEALVKMNYATSAEVTKAIADSHGVAFVDLTDVEIPPSVIELVPESVPRALQTVEGLKRGRSGAEDPDPVRPSLLRIEGEEQGRADQDREKDEEGGEDDATPDET